MEEIVEIAKKLGQAIASNQRFKNLKEAEKAVENDDEAQKLTDELDKQSRKIRDLEVEMRPVEPEDKRKLQQLQSDIAANESLRTFAKAQADYAEIMSKVNQAIQEALR